MELEISAVSDVIQEQNLELWLLPLPSMERRELTARH